MAIEFSPLHFLAHVERDRRYLESIINTMEKRDGSPNDVLRSTIIEVLLNIWFNIKLRN